MTDPGSRAQVLAKAVQRVGDMLQLSANALNKIIEIPENAVSAASIADALVKSGEKSLKRAGADYFALSIAQLGICGR